MEILMLIILFLVLLSIILCLLSLNLIHSVFWLTSSFISTAMMLIVLNLYSIAIIVMIIYVGAIAIMFIFSVMMVDLINLEDFVVSFNFIPLVLVFSVILYFTAEYLTIKINHIDKVDFYSNFDFTEIGLFFFNNFNFFVVGSAIILLIPMVGALIFI